MFYCFHMFLFGKLVYKPKLKITIISSRWHWFGVLPFSWTLNLHFIMITLENSGECRRREKDIQNTQNCLDITVAKMVRPLDTLVSILPSDLATWTFLHPNLKWGIDWIRKALFILWVLQIWNLGKFCHSSVKVSFLLWLALTKLSWLSNKRNLNENLYQHKLVYY